MSSKVELANLALANIHAPSINSFDEGSTEAQYVSIYYPLVRRTLLQSHNWAFINVEKALALLMTDLFDWAYCYQYPSDCIRINHLKSPVNQINIAESGFAVRPEYDDDNVFNDLVNRQLKIPYEVKLIDGNRVIGANEPDLWIDYRNDGDNPDLYSPMFYDTFTWMLGSRLAIPIIGGEVGRAERKNAFGIASDLLPQAIAEDLNETKNRQSGVDESELTLVKG